MKIFKRMLVLAGLLILGLFVFSCEQGDEWVEIYVENASDSKIYVKIEIKGENDWASTVKGEDVEPGDELRYNGSNGIYKITVTDSKKVDYHFPKGKGFPSEKMYNVRRFTFDGDQLQKSPVY